MTKKLKLAISPFLYIMFFIPTVLAILFFVFSIESFFYHFFSPGGILEVILAVLFFGGIFFWTANRLIQRIERLHSPAITDHIRQSLGYYLLDIFCGYVWLTAPSGSHGGLGYGYIMMAFIVSVWAIIVNGIYLMQLRRISKSS